jgi:hypothetical protein
VSSNGASRRALCVDITSNAHSLEQADLAALPDDADTTMAVELDPEAAAILQPRQRQRYAGAGP